MLRSKGKAGYGSDGKPGQQIVVSKFGYGLGVSVDIVHKVVRRFAAFPANVHDSRILGDSAFPSKKNKKFLEKNGLTDEFVEKKPKGKEIPEETARSNAKIAKERARVEHVFGHMKCCRGLTIRTIGLARAGTKLSSAVPAYNIGWFIFLKRRRCIVG